LPAIRLQRLLARHGLGSRRSCEDLIRSGRVTVNGQVAELGSTAEDGDVVLIDGQPLRPEGPPRYLMLHKPPGYLVTMRDARGRPTVLDLLPQGLRHQVFPVGRLDLDSEGLLLLTNDGDFANHLMHPRYELSREYLVWVAGALGPRAVDRLAAGVEIDPGVIVRANAEIVQVWHGGGLLRFEIHEGKKREIRRMCSAVRLRVKRLKRVALGPVRLGELPPGKTRPLTAMEVAALRKASAAAHKP
jgi:23S rRNA pseudouridine2605 synthase